MNNQNNIKKILTMLIRSTDWATVFQALDDALIEEMADTRNDISTRARCNEIAEYLQTLDLPSIKSRPKKASIKYIKQWDIDTPKWDK